MKKFLIILLFVPFFLWRPTPIIYGQKPEKPKSILDYVDKKIQHSFNEIFLNLDTLTALSAKKPKTIYVPKVKYIKTYKTVPVYFVEKDTVVYKATYPADTVSDFIVVPELQTNDSTPKKKKGFFHNLFH